MQDVEDVARSQDLRTSQDAHEGAESEDGEHHEARSRRMETIMKRMKTKVKSLAHQWDVPGRGLFFGIIGYHGTQQQQWAFHGRGGYTRDEPY